VPGAFAGFAVETRLSFAGSNARANYFSKGRGMPALGHFRPIQPVLPAGPCPLNSESDRIFASSRNAAMGYNTSRSFT
jgi:hypothetical protein